MAGSSLRPLVRWRLLIVPLLIAALMCAAVLAAMGHQARRRVADERASATDLARHLISTALATLPPGDEPMAGLAARIGGLAGLRHVRLFLLPAQEEAMIQWRGAADRSSAVPGWFAAMLRPPPDETRWPVIVDGRPQGAVVLVADADDELGEVWDDMLVLAGAMAGLLGVFVVLVAWSVARASRPLAMIGAGLARLERGDYAAEVPPFDIGGLDPLRLAFNRLVATLRQMTGDNRKLIHRLIAVQESERTRLAHDLHDEFGPTLFAVRAQAAMIARPGDATDSVAHARTILALADDLQALNRRILDNLRPAALHDLGLVAALGQLVEDWRARQPALRWRFVSRGAEPEPGDPAGLAIYRVVQESLTNAARHSAATMVSVDLSFGPVEPDALEWNGAPGDAVARVVVSDDGIGMAGAPRLGFGLLGLRERVLGLGGMVRITSPDSGGTRIEALIALGRNEDRIG
jgi:two-component system sensor histidine kinase UhpB